MSSFASRRDVFDTVRESLFSSDFLTSEELANPFGDAAQRSATNAEVLVERMKSVAADAGDRRERRFLRERISELRRNISVLASGTERWSLLASILAVRGIREAFNAVYPRWRLAVPEEVNSEIVR
jgi:hypothetical protein